jgi:hypothetical protein
MGLPWPTRTAGRRLTLDETLPGWVLDPMAQERASRLTSIARSSAVRYYSTAGPDAGCARPCSKTIANRPIALMNRPSPAAVR